VLSVPENANDGWVATLNGHQLARTRVDGWQQAWLVPAGAGGVVTLDFTPDTAYRTRLLVGLLAALALLVAIAIPARRRKLDLPEAGHRWVPIVLVVLTGALGGMLSLIVLIGCLLVRQVRRAWPPWIALGGVTAATVIAVTGRLLDLGQDWAYGAPAQAALQIAVAAVVATCINWFIDAERRNPETRHSHSRR
jgi:arabinofuranan 3-O-arabinosyltransferase